MAVAAALASGCASSEGHPPDWRTVAQWASHADVTSPPTALAGTRAWLTWHCLDASDRATMALTSLDGRPLWSTATPRPRGSHYLTPPAGTYLVQLTHPGGSLCTVRLAELAPATPTPGAGSSGRRPVGRSPAA